MYDRIIKMSGRIAGEAGEATFSVLHTHSALVAEHYPVIVHEIDQIAGFVEPGTKVHGLVVTTVQDAYPLDGVDTVGRAACRGLVYAAWYAVVLDTGPIAASAPVQIKLAPIGQYGGTHLPEGEGTTVVGVVRCGELQSAIVDDIDSSVWLPVEIEREGQANRHSASVAL